MRCPLREGPGEQKSDARAQGNNPRFPWEPSTAMLTYRLNGTTKAPASNRSGPLKYRRAAPARQSSQHHGAPSHERRPIADLGFGLPAESAMRSSLIGTAIARRMGVTDAEVADVLYTGLLAHLGCIGFAHETAAVFGDELAMTRAVARTNIADPDDIVRSFVPTVTAGMAPARRDAIVAFLISSAGERFGERFNVASCEVGRDVARRLGLSAGVQRGVYEVLEWWNGHGGFRALNGKRSRCRLGWSRSVRSQHTSPARVGRRPPSSRSGPGPVAPSIRRLWRRSLATQQRSSVGWRAATHGTWCLRSNLHPSTPSPTGACSPAYSPTWSISSRHTCSGIPPTRRTSPLQPASGSGSAADRFGSCTWPRCSMTSAGSGSQPVSGTGKGYCRRRSGNRCGCTPYHSERILATSPALTELAPVVGMHHERPEGSGYYRGCRNPTIPMAARVLAAADRFQTLTQRRPHRAARPAEQAAEVLGLVARGLSNREIAGQLGISSRTAEHHVQHVYSKIGVSSRAAAALFAMEHGLLS
jgi:DNA-binding CsgD family transcriptional regulator